MPTRISEAEWNGDLFKGKGIMKFGSGAFEGQYSFSSRFEEGTGTNPEELIGAAHAGCYSMALSGGLAAAGHTPDSIHTTAKVTVDKVGDGFAITKIALSLVGKVPNIDLETFTKFAEDAKINCPVSKALASVPDITLDIKLV